MDGSLILVRSSRVLSLMAETLARATDTTVPTEAAVSEDPSPMARPGLAVGWAQG